MRFTYNITMTSGGPSFTPAADKIISGVGDSACVHTKPLLEASQVRYHGDQPLHSCL